MGDDGTTTLNRFALLVDAGYLLSGAGELTLGTSSRAALRCAYSDCVPALIEYAKNHCGQELLRVYWYDGAVDAQPTSEHKLIAGLDNVKVRLGQLTRSGQKGVDSRIVRDLMTLAREHAITTAFVLSGDEDLREGVADAQDVGVWVVLLGIPGSNQAQTLIREADEHIVLAKDFISPFMSLLPQLITIELPRDYISSAAPEEVAYEIGRWVAEDWVRRASSEEVHVAMRGRPRVPPELFAALQVSADRNGVPKRARGALRGAFWDEVAAAVGRADAERESP